MHSRGRRPQSHWSKQRHRSKQDTDKPHNCSPGRCHSRALNLLRPAPRRRHGLCTAAATAHGCSEAGGGVHARQGDHAPPTPAARRLSRRLLTSAHASLCVGQWARWQSLEQYLGERGVEGGQKRGTKFQRGWVREKAPRSKHTNAAAVGRARGAPTPAVAGPALTRSPGHVAATAGRHRPGAAPAV
jgi:hypothetical protein